MKKVPKYIQECIKRMFYCDKVIKSNARVVEQWINDNKIDRTIPLSSLLEPSSSKKHSFISKGQMTIFDYEGVKE